MATITLDSDDPDVRWFVAVYVTGQPAPRGNGLPARMARGTAVRLADKIAAQMPALLQDDDQ